MKRLVAFLLVLMLALTGLSALAEGQKTKVVFWYSLGGTNAEVIASMTEAFNASQDKIEVEAQYQGEYDDAINKLKATAMGEALPFDIVQSYEIGSRFIIDSGKMVPVQTYIDKTGFDVSVIEPNLLALDSGCFWGRHLTAVRLDDRALFQVDCSTCEETA